MQNSNLFTITWWEKTLASATLLLTSATLLTSLSVGTDSFMNESF